jgi:hypothetical protein
LASEVTIAFVDQEALLEFSVAPDASIHEHLVAAMGLHD